MAGTRFGESRSDDVASGGAPRFHDTSQPFANRAARRNSRHAGAVFRKLGAIWQRQIHVSPTQSYARPAD